MKKIIHRLWSKPEEEKINMLYFLTLVCAIILIFLWTMSLGRTISSPEVKQKMKQDLEPLSTFKNDMVGVVKGQNSQSRE